MAVGVKTYLNSIGGEWVGAAGGEAFESVNPATGEALGEFPAGQAALDFFTEWKSVYVDYSGRLQRAQIDNR